ncbi:MAG: MCP four helix bundle domain-containing protein, partial [Candidatus Kapabacteria bacterium]|nr:MCP four helix bundle domain-containing protein [Candidatus Kapabacteria bacterium]
MKKLIQYLESLTIKRSFQLFSILAIISILYVGYTAFPALKRMNEIHTKFYEHPFKTTNNVQNIKYNTIYSARKVRNIINNSDSNYRFKEFQTIKKLNFETYNNLLQLRTTFLGDQKLVTVSEVLFKKLDFHFNRIIELSNEGKNKEAWDLSLNESKDNPYNELIDNLDKIYISANNFSLKI